MVKPTALRGFTQLPSAFASPAQRSVAAKGAITYGSPAVKAGSNLRRTQRFPFRSRSREQEDRDDREGLNASPVLSRMSECPRGLLQMASAAAGGLFSNETADHSKRAAAVAATAAAETSAVNTSVSVSNAPLKSCISHKKRKSASARIPAMATPSRRNVKFGSPNAAEFNHSSPSNRLTPMPTADLKKFYSEKDSRLQEAAEVRLSALLYCRERT